MYYFLAHGLSNLPNSKSRKERLTISQNTFILALDGDVDFQPKAVQLLVDRMRKNIKVGAACGRIHPIGSGNYLHVNILNNTNYEPHIVVKAAKVASGELHLMFGSTDFGIDHQTNL